MFTKSLFPSIIFSILPKIRKKCKGLPKNFLKYFRLSQKLLLTKRLKNTKVLLSKANGKILKPFRFFNRPIAPGIALRSTAPLGFVLSGRFFICRISFGLPQVFHKFSTNLWKDGKSPQNPLDFLYLIWYNIYNYIIIPYYGFFRTVWQTSKGPLRTDPDDIKRKDG